MSPEAINCLWIVLREVGNNIAYFLSAVVLALVLVFIFWALWLIAYYVVNGHDEQNH